jgi:hypothetical protein
LTEFQLGTGGGTKNMWLRQNHDLVMGYYRTFGREETMLRFNLKNSTLDSLLTRHNNNLLKQSEAEKLNTKVNYLIDALNDTRTEVRGLKRDYSRFTAVVADTISRQFLEPLIRHTIQVPDSLELKPMDDPLRIDDVDFRNE